MEGKHQCNALMHNNGTTTALLDFLDSSKTAADIHAKLSETSPVSIWCLPKKNQKNLSRTFWENGVLLTSGFAILGKNSKCLKAARMFGFEARHNQKTPNSVKLNVLQYGYLGFVIFFDFDPKNSKFQFFKNNCLKIKNFQVIQKNGINVIEIHTNTTRIQNFKAIYLFLAVQWPKKTLMMSHFWNAN